MSTKPSDSLQHIQFEGCDVCVIAPEDYDDTLDRLSAENQRSGREPGSGAYVTDKDIEIVDLRGRILSLAILGKRYETRIRELEACVIEYWHAKDWAAVGAADATAAKLLPADMKTRAALETKP
jgi:hypothetical protein